MLFSLGQKGLIQKMQFPKLQLEAVAKSGIFSQLQTGPKGCHSEKRKKRGKTTVPHVDIKKKRTLANCTTTTGWKSPADTTWSREFWVYSFYFRKASTQFLQLLKYGLNRFSHYYKSIVKQVCISAHDIDRNNTQITCYMIFSWLQPLKKIWEVGWWQLGYKCSLRAANRNGAC